MRAFGVVSFHAERLSFLLQKVTTKSFLVLFTIKLLDFIYLNLVHHILPSAVKFCHKNYSARMQNANDKSLTIKNENYFYIS